MRRYAKRITGLTALAVLVLAVAWKTLPDTAEAPSAGSAAKNSHSLALSACTPTPLSDSLVLDVPYISQEAYPTGCESVSAVMLLQFWGIDIDVDTFIDDYLDCGQFTWQGETPIGPSPNDRFVGNPRSEDSYGCYAPVIERAVTSLLPKNYAVINRTGSVLPALAQRYLDRQIPVLIWATIDMKETYVSASWIDEKDGSTVQWLVNEHCLVLVGYDDEAYYCNDPYKNNGVMRYSRELLESRFKSMGSQALAIVPDE